MLVTSLPTLPTHTHNVVPLILSGIPSRQSSEKFRKTFDLELLVFFIPWWILVPMYCALVIALSLSFAFWLGFFSFPPQLSVLFILICVGFYTLSPNFFPYCARYSLRWNQYISTTLITNQPIQGFREMIRKFKCKSECNV